MAKSETKKSKKAPKASQDVLPGEYGIALTELLLGQEDLRKRMGETDQLKAEKAELARAVRHLQGLLDSEREAHAKTKEQLHEAKVRIVGVVIGPGGDSDQVAAVIKNAARFMRPLPEFAR